MGRYTACGDLQASKDKWAVTNRKLYEASERYKENGLSVSFLFFLSSYVEISET